MLYWRSKKPEDGFSRKRKSIFIGSHRFLSIESKLTFLCPDCFIDFSYFFEGSFP